MPKNVIVIKKPNELVHPSYLGRVVKEYNTYMGTALVHDGKLVIDHRIGQPTVDAIMELQKELQSLQIMFVFGENKTLLEEDMMPYLIKVTDDHHVALGLEGNFHGYAVKGSAHVNEFHVKEDFLKLKLPKLYKTANAGMAGLLEELKDPITQQDLSNSWTDRGFIALLAAEGPAVTLFNKGNLFRADYNWGSTSQSMGYVEKTEAKVEDQPVVLSTLERLKLKMAGKPIPEAAKPAELPPEKKTETSTVQTAIHNKTLADNEEWVGPAPEKLTNKQKSEWWIREVGYCPDAYKKADVRVKRFKGTKKGVLAPLVAGTGPQPETVHLQQTIEDAATVGTAERHPMKADNHLPDKRQPDMVKDVEPKLVSTDNMLIMSPRQKLKLKNGWMMDSDVVKTLGDDFTVLSIDPKRLKEFEENWQSFWDGIGMEPRWLSPVAITKLGVDDLKALCQFAFNAQNEAFKLGARLNSILSNPNNKLDRVAM